MKHEGEQTSGRRKANGSSSPGDKKVWNDWFPSPAVKSVSNSKTLPISADGNGKQSGEQQGCAKQDSNVM